MFSFQDKYFIAFNATTSKKSPGIGRLMFIQNIK